MAITASTGSLGGVIQSEPFGLAESAAAAAASYAGDDGVFVAVVAVVVDIVEALLFVGDFLEPATVITFGFGRMRPVGEDEVLAAAAAESVPAALLLFGEGILLILEPEETSLLLELERFGVVEGDDAMIGRGDGSGAGGFPPPAPSLVPPPFAVAVPAVPLLPSFLPGLTAAVGDAIGLSSVTAAVVDLLPPPVPNGDVVTFITLAVSVSIADTLDCCVDCDVPTGGL